MHLFIVILVVNVDISVRFCRCFYAVIFYSRIGKNT